MKSELIFAVTPSLESDSAKIAFIINLFSGEAFNWIRPFLLADPKPAWVSNWIGFKAKLLEDFRDADLKETSRRALANLKQTSSVSSYAVEFRRHTPYLAWGEEAFRQTFFDGLKDDIKDRVLSPNRTDIANLEALITMCQDYDNLLTQRRRTGTTTSTTTKPRTIASMGPLPSKSSATPMEVDASSNKFRGPLSQAEKDRRRSMGLCSYCGQGGHFADKCPKIPGRLAALDLADEE